MKGWTKGQPLREWIRKRGMTEQEVTSARVYMTVGLVFGLVLGILGTLLFLVLRALVMVQQMGATLD